MHVSWCSWRGLPRRIIGSAHIGTSRMRAAGLCSPMAGWLSATMRGCSMFRRSLLGAAALASLTTLVAPMTAQAQAWKSFPDRPIKLVIAFPAGGPTDITMRSLADNPARVLVGPVIVENKPGAGGTLPAQTLQTVPADGYTIAQIPLGVFRLGYTTKINWDPLKDISYVLNVTGYAFGIVVPANSPFKT